MYGYMCQYRHIHITDIFVYLFIFIYFNAKDCNVEMLPYNLFFLIMGRLTVAHQRTKKDIIIQSIDLLFKQTMRSPLTFVECYQRKGMNKSPILH